MKSLNPNKKYAEVFLAILFLGTFSLGRKLFDDIEDVSGKSIIAGVTIAAIFMIAGIASALSDLRDQLSRKNLEIKELKSQIEDLRRTS